MFPLFLIHPHPLTAPTHTTAGTSCFKDLLTFQAASTEELSQCHSAGWEARVQG